MAKVTSNATVSVTVYFSCDEEECRALDAMVGYGFESFITTFKKHMGEAYMRGHEDGLKRFFESVRGIVGPAISRVTDARMAFDGMKEIAYKGAAVDAAARQSELNRLQKFLGEKFPEMGEGAPVTSAIKLLSDLAGKGQASTRPTPAQQEGQT